MKRFVSSTGGSEVGDSDSERMRSLRNRSAAGTKAKVRDAFVFLEVFGQEGGIQSYVKNLLRTYLTLTEGMERQAEVFLLRDEPGCSNSFTDSPLNFRYYKTQPALLGRFRLAVALLTHLIRQRPQQVFCGHVNLAPLIQGICQPLGIPYSVMTHGKEVWERLPPLKRRALQQADRLWMVSRYSRDRACAANGLDPAKVRFLPGAIDGDIFTPGPKSTDLINRYGLADARVLLTVARLWPGDIYKGVDVTIRALPQIAQQFPNVKYLVIGRGADQPRLAQLATDLGVGDRVVFAGFIPDGELVAHYRLADAYVMPSQEGFGLVYLEAMACGIPVLAGDADGSADPLQDGRLGWQVPHRDPEAVATACIEILQGTDPRCKGAWLRQESQTLFGRQAFADRLQQILME